jgi:hypothetical protein
MVVSLLISGIDRGSIDDELAASDSIRVDVGLATQIRELSLDLHQPPQARGAERDGRARAVERPVPSELREVGRVT